MAGMGFLAFSHHKSAKNTVVEPKGEQQPGTPTTTAPSTSPTASSQPSRESSSGISSSGSRLPVPTGQVINVKSISLSAMPCGNAQPAPNCPNLESTCQTIVGGNCTLKISGSKAVTIQPSSTDGNGQFIFDWNAGKVGLTPGDWNVQLVAEKDGQTSSSGVEVLHVSS